MKSQVARLARGVSLVTGMALRRARALKRPRVLMYHAVGSGGVPLRVFEAQLALLRREFDAIPLPDLLHRYAEGRCTGREVAVTFDDGVRNHLSTVYPALRAAGVPATFFLCPGLMSTGQWIWNMEARARLRTLGPPDRKTLAERHGWPSADTEELIAWAKTLPLTDRQAFEEAVRAQTSGFAPSARQLDECTPLTWDEARSLDTTTVTIGSHTVNHPILPTLPADEQRRELAESRRQLEDGLGRPVDIFCYPNGDNDPGVVERVRETYRWAVTTEENTWRPDLDPCRLPRVPAANDMALFVRRLYRPTS